MMYHVSYNVHRLVNLLFPFFFSLCRIDCLPGVARPFRLCFMPLALRMSHLFWPIGLSLSTIITEFHLLDN